MSAVEMKVRREGIMPILCDGTEALGGGISNFPRFYSY